MSGVDGANRHDMKLVEQTLQSIMADRPEPRPPQPQYLCMDKGYDFDEVRHLVARYGYSARILPRGQEKVEKNTLPGYRARRWAVERTHSWLNRFRRLLIRWGEAIG